MTDVYWLWGLTKLLCVLEVLRRTNRVSPSGLFRRLALSARCCSPTSAVRLPPADPSAQISLHLPRVRRHLRSVHFRPTSPRTACTTRPEVGLESSTGLHFRACGACAEVLKSVLNIFIFLQVKPWWKQILTEPRSFVEGCLGLAMVTPSPG